MEWINVEQEMPVPYKSVWVQARDLKPEHWQPQDAPDGEYEGFWADDEQEWNCFTKEPSLRCLYPCAVTHWMPLPAPPLTTPTEKSEEI